MAQCPASNQPQPSADGVGHDDPPDIQPIDRVERGADGLLRTVCCGARIVMISTGAGCEHCGATITQDPGETLDLLRNAD
jgi:hypothetical protein